MNYYSHHIGDYRRDTMHLSLIEHGIYRQLLDQYYLGEKPIGLDESKLMRSLCVRIADDMQSLKNVLADFFVRTESGYIHKRCDIEIEAFHAKSKSAAESAKARWDRVHAEKDAVAMRSHSDGNANHKPITNNHINTLVLGDAEDVIQIASTAKPSCPHQEIIDLYHEALPVCPRIKDWTPARQAHLRARWNEDSQRQNLDYWRRLFEYIGKCDFLVGRSPTMPGKSPFVAGLDWIVKSENFAKIREAKYENRSAA